MGLLKIYDYGMNFVWTERIFTIIGGICCITILIWYIIEVFSQWHEIRKNSNRVVLLFICSGLVFFFFFIKIMLDGCNVWLIRPPGISCPWYVRMEFCSFILGKSFMYFVLVLRVDVVFKDTYLNYSRTINVLYFILFVAAVVSTGSVFLYISGELHLRPARECFAVWSSIQAFVFVGFDVLMSFSCLTLFSSRLRYLMSCDESTKEASKDLLYLLKKNSLITYICVLSTFIFNILLGIIGMSIIFGTTDQTINCFAIFLSLKFNTKLFNKCCNPILLLTTDECCDVLNKPCNKFHSFVYDSDYDNVGSPYDHSSKEMASTDKERIGSTDSMLDS